MVPSGWKVDTPRGRKTSWYKSMFAPGHLTGGVQRIKEFRRKRKAPYGSSFRVVGGDFRNGIQG